MGRSKSTAAMSSERGRNPPLRRGDGEQSPFAGDALELVSAALLELKP
jgi:hypothetical protein